MKILDFLTDAHGTASHARLIAIIVALVGSATVATLAWKGALTEYYFGFYLLYGTGTQTINKFLDVISVKFGGRLPPEAKSE